MYQDEMLTKVAIKISECKKCSLARDRLVKDHWTVPGQGNPSAKIVFLSDVPETEDLFSGGSMGGEAGQMFDDMLASLNWTRDQVFVTSIVKCRPEGVNPPKFTESQRCRPFLDLQLRVVRPSHIVCLGKRAALHLLYTEGNRTKWFTRKLSDLRGKIYEKDGFRVICTHHPRDLCKKSKFHSEAWEDLQLLVKDLRALHSEYKD